MLFGTLCLWLGTLAGCMVTFLVGQHWTCKGCVEKMPLCRCIAPCFNTFEDSPMKLLILLRISPVIPFNLLNYYAGACGRFSLRHVFVAHIFTAPAIFMWVGTGGAILKFRLVARGEASDERYLPFIWAGFSTTLVFMIASTVYGACVVKKTASAADDGEFSVPAPPKTTTRSYSNVVLSGIEVGGVNPPPPPPPPATTPGGLPPGWRICLTDENETYFFNDDTGESSWDMPG